MIHQRLNTSMSTRGHNTNGDATIRMR